jgi:hypothetical protein
MPKEGVRVSGSASPQVDKRGYSKSAIGDALVVMPPRKRWRLEDGIPTIMSKKIFTKDDFKRRRSSNAERKRNRKRRDELYEHYQKAMKRWRK